MAGAVGTLPGLLHDPSGHHDREHRDPGDQRQARRVAVGHPVDPQLVRARLRRPAHHGRPARRPVRAQAALPHRPRDLHACVGRVRLRADPGPADHLPGGTGHRRRVADAADAVGTDRDLPTGKTWGRVRHLGRDGRCRHDRRPGCRRLAGHRLRLALDLLRQPAGGRRRAGRRRDRDAQPQAQPAAPPGSSGSGPRPPSAGDGRRLHCGAASRSG